MLIKAKEADTTPAIELTPVIDMVFLLLIFFLVATTFHQTEREMQIVLPEAATGGPISLALRELVVNVESDGDIIVSGRRVDERDLRVIVEEAVAANAEQKVTVRGDRSAAYGTVARVLDICKGAGIQEPYLDTVPLR
jgi:biopolymer transport protein ExbD